MRNTGESPESVEKDCLKRRAQQLQWRAGNRGYPADDYPSESQRARLGQAKVPGMDSKREYVFKARQRKN